jgi:hypothetical protein
MALEDGSCEILFLLAGKINMTKKSDKGLRWPHSQKFGGASLSRTLSKIRKVLSFLQFDKHYNSRPPKKIVE